MMLKCSLEPRYYKNLRNLADDTSKKYATMWASVTTANKPFLPQTESTVVYGEKKSTTPYVEIVSTSTWNRLNTDSSEECELGIRDENRWSAQTVKEKLTRLSRVK